MNTFVTFALCITTVSLIGCTSNPSAATREPYVKPGLILLTADQAERRGITLQTSSPREAGSPNVQVVDSNHITTAADIRVYTLNRMVDPADSNLMHEEHVVYRRETAPRWRVDASAEQKILVGPRITDGRQDLKPLLDKELTTYLADQRRATEANQQAISTLLKAVEALSRQQQTVMEREIRQSHSEGPAPAASGASDSSPSSTTDPRN